MPKQRRHLCTADDVQGADSTNIYARLATDARTHEAQCELQQRLLKGNREGDKGCGQGW